MTISYGKYQVLEQVGEGGFGRVFRAFDPVLKREVAIKTCTLHDPDVRARFVREAEVVASLKHPHIVTVYDFGIEEGEPYLVQEFLSGQDLRQALDSSVFADMPTKVRWLRQTADGLYHAHSKGVIHRYIKPSNVRIQVDGEVRIMDFGIAKLVQAQQQLTQTGLSVGTVGYLAPEQFIGRDIDQRADIFSFGVLAYEVISGRKPFVGDDVTAILYRIAHEDPPPLNEVAPDCPASLVECVNICLQKDRERRWSSFLPVIGELDAVAGALSRGEGAAGDAAEQRSSGRGLRVSPTAVGLGTGVVAVALFGVVSLSQLDRSQTGDPLDRRLPMPDYGGGPGVTAGDTLPAGSVESAVVEVADARLAASTGNPEGRQAGTPASDTGVTSTPEIVARPLAPPTRGQPATPQLDMRRLVVLVHADSRAVEDAAASTIVSALQEAGFTIVDDAVVDATPGLGAPRPNALAALGRAHGAGYVVFIDAASEAVPFSGMYTGMATITARVYDVRDGSLAGTGMGAVGSGGTPGKLGVSPAAATADAARAAADKVVAGIRKSVERN